MNPRPSLAEQLLTRIRRSRGTAVSYTRLAKQLNCGQTAIETSLAELITWGYKIRRRRHEAVTFVAAPDLLTELEIGHFLKTKQIGRPLHCFRLVKSTNDLAIQLAESGAPEGTTVTAEEQSAGRGRLGRAWHSPANAGIYLSLILRPKIKPAQAPGLSVLTALALAETLERLIPGEVRIKWPNDVLISGRKVAGILTELAADRNRVQHVVVGVGINANHRATDFPDSLRETATSLRRELKRSVSRPELLAEFLGQLEKEYRRFQTNLLKAARKRLRRYSVLLGHTVQLQSGSERIEGLAVDIDADGALVLEVDGARRAIAAGEVTVIK